MKYVIRKRVLAQCWFRTGTVVRPSGLLSFVPALLLSILTPLFLSSSFVSLSYFILTVPIRECLGKHSCTSSQFPVSYFYKQFNTSFNSFLFVCTQFVTFLTYFLGNSAYILFFVGYHLALFFKSSFKLIVYY